MVKTDAAAGRVRHSFAVESGRDTTAGLARLERRQAQPAVDSAIDSRVPEQQVGRPGEGTRSCSGGGAAKGDAFPEITRAVAIDGVRQCDTGRNEDCDAQSGLEDHRRPPLPVRCKTLRHTPAFSNVTTAAAREITKRKSADVSPVYAVGSVNTVRSLRAETSLHGRAGPLRRIHATRKSRTCPTKSTANTRVAVQSAAFGQAAAEAQRRGLVTTTDTTTPLETASSASRIQLKRGCINDRDLHRLGGR